MSDLPRTDYEAIMDEIAAATSPRELEWLRGYVRGHFARATEREALERMIDGMLRGLRLRDAGRDGDA